MNQIEISELKSTITKFKKSLEEPSSRIKMTEERVNLMLKQRKLFNSIVV